MTISHSLARLSASLSPSMKKRLKGFKGIYRSAMSLSGTVEVETKAGKFLWHIDELTSQQHILGTYELGAQKEFIRYIKPGMVVYDIGAHAGFHSLFCSLLGAKVFAFEPHPTNQKSLARQVRLNNFDITIIPYALSDRDGQSYLDDSRGDCEGFISDKGIPVELRRLDALDLPAPDLIKIDVEGHEGQVILGALETIKKHHPIILCDWNDDLTLESVFQYLSGYRVESKNRPIVFRISPT